MTDGKNVPLNEIPTLITVGKVSQLRFVTDERSADETTSIPADQKAGTCQQEDRQITLPR